MRKLNIGEPVVLEIKTTKGIKLLSVKRILFIKAEKKGSCIYLNDSEFAKTTNSLKWYNQYLFLPEFYRCHNSYLINCNYVDCFCGCQIILKGNIRIPLSRSKVKLFKDNINKLESSINY